MTSTSQWICFGIGIVFLLIGAGLMVYGAVQRRRQAGRIADTADLIRAIAALLEPLARFLGPGNAANVGFVLVLVGLILIFVPVFVPARA